MANEIGKVGIGNKEVARLKPAMVKITSYKVEMQKNKQKVDVGEKVIVSCKHPDKAENIEISAVAYRKGKEIKNSGLWFQLDDDKLITKGSALASLLIHLNVNNLNELVGKDVLTELDEKGYLCFKGY